MATFLHGPFLFVAATAAVSGFLKLSGIQQDQSSTFSSVVYTVNNLESDAVDDNDNDNDLSSGYTQAAQDDAILNLPGLDYDPGFKQFSGYLTVDQDHGRNIFYWYVESQGDPTRDPVVLWTNGGPGCSGFVGFGTEHGPYYISTNGTLSANPFSWNLVASMLYIEQPAGVGFSYSDTESDYSTGDAKAASDNYKLIQEFFKRYPERKSNPFYISSESYGGHYMPQLTLEILKQDTEKTINFQGMLVGNPYVDPFSNTLTQIQAFYSHGLLPKPLFDQWKDHCTTPDTYDGEDCQAMEVEMFKGLYHKINPYALDYPICIEEEEAAEAEAAAKAAKEQQGLTTTTTMQRLHHRRRLQQKDTSSQAEKLLNYSAAGGPPFLPTEDVYRPCSELHLEKYLNRPDVREAIHVSSKAGQWYSCSSLVDYDPADFSASIIDLYKVLIPKASIENGLQVFVYSGDDDSVCATAGTQYWIYDLGFPYKANLLWQSWKVQGEVAGYVTTFELGAADTKGSFVFATVHGAGHEVPAYRPMEALEMFKKVLNKEW